MTRAPALLTAIVSDGRPGAARGALEAAIDLGLGFGGWAPSGWHDGELPSEFRERMREGVTQELGMIVRLNVQDSDGTLIVSLTGKLTGCAAYVDRVAEQQRKASLQLVLPAGGRSTIPDSVRREVLEWMREARIDVLHVAGPREADQPGIQQATREALAWLLEDELGDVASDAAPIGGAEGLAGELTAAGAQLEDLGQDAAEPLEEQIARLAHEIAKLPTGPLPMSGPAALRYVALTNPDPAIREIAAARLAELAAAEDLAEDLAELGLGPAPLAAEELAEDLAEDLAELAGPAPLEG